MAASMRHVSTTLFVRNLPFTATKDDLETVFSDVGPIKNCFVVTDKGIKDKCRGFGYVTFALKDDAEKAVKVTKTLEGRKLRVDFADRKPRKGAPSPGKPAETDSAKATTETEVTPPPAEKSEEDKPQAKNTKKKKKKNKGGGTDSTGEKEKRKCRLIIRNLPFKCSEDELKSIFEAFGTVVEVSIPVKDKTGKKLGFGFVQFDEMKNAAKAVKQMNGKEIMERTVAVDWTVSREEYREAMKKAKARALENASTREESEDDDDEEEEEEEDDEEDDDEDDDEEEMSEDEDMAENSENGDDNDDEEDDDDDEDMGSDVEEEEEDEEDSEEGDDEEEEEGEEEEEEEEGTGEEEQELEQAKTQAAKKPPEDVQEGKTLFIRNVPYDSTNDDISELFSPFGELEFARVVVDPMTEHSRGTAFVKFKRKEDAENCIQEGDAVRLSGRLLAISPAISRSEAIKLRTAEKEKTKEEQKDKRNLHLLREGLIRPGTKAAAGLSEVYMNKRLKVENMKKEKLKNLSIFMSPTRLAVHNLPKAVDDKKLKTLAWEAVKDKKAKVTEARIMRDLNNPNSQGTCKSLGFGFVEFDQHQHALAALLHLNNNPDLFGPEKRPIVGFSLENRRALEMKQKRREKAMMKQQAFSGKDQSEAEPPTRTPYSQHKQQARQRAEADPPPHQKAQATVMPAGGKKKGLPRHFGAKNRWRDRGKVAEEKRQRRKEKRLVLQKQVWSSMKDPTPVGDLGITKRELRKEKQKNQKKKQGRGVKEEKQFNALVNKYKQKITRGGNQRNNKTSSKWFET